VSSRMNIPLADPRSTRDAQPDRIGVVVTDADGSNDGSAYETYFCSEHGSRHELAVRFLRYGPRWTLRLGRLHTTPI